MSNPHFFISMDDAAVLQELISGDGDNTFSGAMIDLTVDIVDVPFWLSLVQNSETVTCKVFQQADLYHALNDEIAVIDLERKTANVNVEASESVEDYAASFALLAALVSLYAATNIPQEVYADLDPDEAGILLEAKGDEIVWKVVSGKNRPELTCQTLFGGVTTCRPYMDDFWERSMMDDMDADELRQAAEDGDENAMETLFLAYENGDEDREIEPDPEQAVYWLKKLADAGSAIGMFNLGLHAAKGFGMPRDFAAAADWMEKAAKVGDDDAPALIKEYRKLAEAEEKAANGDAQAMADLAGGLMMLGGSLDQAGAGDDYVECFKWAKKSADAGCADAYWPLALAYEHGRGVEEDIDKAIEYYRHGAELGNAACQHSYACYFLRGENVKLDSAQAIALLEKSAAQNYALAYRTLGHVYEAGEFVDPDLDLELNYYEKACLARPDDTELLRHVGYQYMNLMDEKDEEKWLHGVERAAYWLKEAADRGDPIADGSEFEQILKLYQQGVISAGTSFGDCLEYLCGDGKGNTADE